MPLYRIRANLNLALEPFIDQELVKVTRTDRGIEVEMKSEMLFKAAAPRSPEVHSVC